LEEVERIGRLAERWGVSDMTIRRDLEELSENELLEKVHGGAVAIPKTGVEPHFIQKRSLNRPEKLTIARAAALFVEEGHTIAMSAGTTTWYIASELSGGHTGLSFITNSTNVAQALQERGWDQIVLSGGIFRTPSDALVGPFADRTIQTLNADILFLGVHGIDPRAGLTTPNIAEAETDRLLVQASQRVIVVSDHTKLGVAALARIAPLSEVDVFITDEGAPRETLREIELAGVRVIVAAVD
jgi:DeoR/GlpR family transcriptional regulator of sugar metabolism